MLPSGSVDPTEPLSTASIAVGIVIGAVILMAIPQPLLADSDPDLLHVQEVRWGFDGRVQTRTFVPVSCLIQNVSQSTETWSLALSRSAGIDRPLGAPIVVEVTLGPDEVRWVQLVPYVWDDFETWTLRWGPEDRHMQQFAGLQTGRKATVYLYPTDAVAFATGSLRTFPAELFPVCVTATDALDGVILDHTPFWQGARARAFREWLRRGGRVFLLHDRNGRFPRFPEELDLLNDERTSYRVGQGSVERIAMSVKEIDHDFAVETFYRDFESTRPQASLSPTWSPTPQNYLWQGRDGLILNELSALSQFSRNWIVIYGVALAYVAVLFPGCYLVARRSSSIAPYYITFVGASVLFSLAFVLLARVGGAEVNRIRVAAVAKELSPGVFDVTQWWTAATVSEGRYHFSHAGSGRAYSTGQDLEAVDGVLYAEPDARMEAYLPPAGYRAGVHRARVRLGDASLDVREWRFVEGAIEALECSTMPLLETPPRLAWFFDGTSLTPLEIDGWNVTYRPGASRQQLSGFLASRPSWHRTRLWWIADVSAEDAHISATVRFNSLAPALVAGLCGLHSTIDENILRSLAGQTSLLILADLHEGLRAEGSQFPDQQGVVLYQFPLPLGS